MSAIGIDLGTTNSVAAIGGKDPRILPEPGGEHLVPSVVSLKRSRAKPEGEIVVGRLAVNNARADPLNTIFSIKRLMGLVYGDELLGKGYGSHGVSDVAGRAILRVAPAPPPDLEDQGVRVQLGDKACTPVEISAMILKQIRANAETALGRPVTHAVITVPAYFEDRQRKATVLAGEMAGLTVLRIIDEPTAAAIAFGADEGNDRKCVLVYDLGGGTFDISIIVINRGKHEVLEIQGDNWLGGDDFDQTIVKRMIESVKDNYAGFDPTGDPVFDARARECARTAKIELSTLESTDIHGMLLTKTPSGTPVDVDLIITRSEFEADIDPLVSRTIGLVRDALTTQGMKPEDISDVLLVGGSTAVPLVQRRLSEVFGRDKLRRHLNPMECVALGAAIFAARCEIKPDGTADTSGMDGPVSQVTALNLGIGAVDGSSTDAFVPIIEKGTPVPLSAPKMKTFRPMFDGQKEFTIPVYEGSNLEFASLNSLQGVLEIPLSEGVRLDTDILVSFNYDGNKNTTVSVKIGDRPPYVETLRRDRRLPARPAIGMEDWRDDLDPSLRMCRHFIQSYGEFMEPEDRVSMEQEIRDGQRALETQDEKEGRRLTSVLDYHVTACGHASVLFIGERTTMRAPGHARAIEESVVALRDALRARPVDGERVSALAGILRTRINRARAEIGQHKTVEDRHTDRLLRKI